MTMLAEFSSLQEAIDGTVAQYLIGKTPELGRRIAKKHLSRLSDEDRWTYVKAFARDVGYPSSLQAAGDAFWRCKHVRDLVGHHQTGGLELVRTHDRKGYYYRLTPKGEIKPQIPTPLTPASFRQLGAECRWLQALIFHLGYLGGLRYISSMARMNTDGQPEPIYMRILNPPALPISPEWISSELWCEIDD